MAILTAGGIYKDESEHLAGGHFIAALTAQHTYEDVYIHTNFSSEEVRLTSDLKKVLQERGVNTASAYDVSAPYGLITHDYFTGSSNIYDTFKAKAKYLTTVEKIILTTDIGERDFRYILNFARKNKIDTVIFTCGEYTPRSAHEDEMIYLENSGIPNYQYHINDIKQKLIDRDFISSEIAENRSIPKDKIHKSGKAVLQLLSLAVLLVIIFTVGFKLLETIDSDNSHVEANIDWELEVDHAECQTVEECTELGDQYLSELKEYVDLQDEPHIFFENRSRTTFINYSVKDYELAEREAVNPLPVDEEKNFIRMWDVFSYVFPHQYISDINEFRLFSDGEGNTSAYVSIERDGTVLAMDVRDNMHKATQYRNLIHEFGHIYSLPIEDFDASCQTTDMSCAKDGTIIADHKERFWSHYDETWHDNSDKSRPQLEGFYNNHVTDFFVPYQTTNVKEDYAITFMKFITEKIPSNSSQLRDVKVQSMYEDAALVAMRVDILKSFVQFEKERAT